MHNIDFNIPFTHPVLIYGIVLLIILIMPMILKRIKIPGIVGLIISGMLIGPNGLNIIVADSNIGFFGNIGLLFIMFIAGLDLDFHEFRKFRKFNILYGVLFFIVPSLLAFLVIKIFFLPDIIPSMLIAIIFSTNTLVSYPIVKRLNIESAQPVIAAVSAAVIADTSILILLGFLKQIVIQGTDIMVELTVIMKFSLYASLLLFLLPKITKIYFKFIDIENTSQFIFIFTLLIFTAVLSYSLDIEPIVGAFLAGLALNKLIPSNSVLMGRIEFIGNALFIPFFLVYVGFLIDLKALFADINAWTYSIIFVSITFSGKFLAVMIAAKLFKIDKESRNLMFGLNLSQAGATIAIAIVVHNLGFLDSNGLNAVIILVLVTCIVSSFITEKYGRLIAVRNADINEMPDIFPQRILVPYTNPYNIESLIKLAILFKEHNSEPIFPLSIITENNDTNKIIYNNNVKFASIKKQAEAINITLAPNVRIDTAIPDGINRAINELMISATIIGWNYKKIDNALYNKLLNQLLNLNDSMILACRVISMQSIKNINIFIPENAEFEKGFIKWIKFINTFAMNLNASINIYKNNKSNYPANYFKSAGIKNINTFGEEFGDIDLDTLVNATSVNIIVKSRIKGISHNAKDNLFVNKFINYKEEANIILLYPEQSNALNPEEVYSYSEIMDGSLILANLNIIDKIKNKIKGSRKTKK